MRLRGELGFTNNNNNNNHDGGGDDGDEVVGFPLNKHQGLTSWTLLPCVC